MNLSSILKISIITGILIVSFSVFYYLVLFIPQREETRAMDSLLSSYKEECKKDIEATFDTVDNLVAGLGPDFLKQNPDAAKNIAIRAGVADEDGYIIDKDILVRNCIERKQSIQAE